MSANPPLHIAWHSVPFTLVECQLACALSIYIRFEDGTPLDDTTIGEIIGASSGLQNVNCAGLVNHLKLTNNVYPEVLAGGPAVAKWARDAWNMWLDPAASVNSDPAASVNSWP